MTASAGPVEPAELLALAVEVAREAAALVRERRRGDVSVAATKSSDIDIVTQADRDCEELVRRRIGERRPDDAFLGEEGDDVVGTSGVRWIVDPIDGTVNFYYGLPQYAVSIAAEVDGTVVGGIVLNAATGTEYTALRDGDRIDSRRDGEPLAVRDAVPLDRMLVSTGFHYTQEVRRLQAVAAGRLLARIRDLRRLGSCALDLCGVAEGTADAYVEEGVNLWDHAAGALVAEGAGATVELTPGAGGQTAIVCAPAAGFRTFREAVADAGFLAQDRE